MNDQPALADVAQYGAKALQTGFEPEAVSNPALKIAQNTASTAAVSPKPARTDFIQDTEFKLSALLTQCRRVWD